MLRGIIFIWCAIFFTFGKCYGAENCNVSESFRLDLLRNGSTYVRSYFVSVRYAKYLYPDFVKFIKKNGDRMPGSKSGERAVDYLIGVAKSWGLNVTTEPVRIPLWIKGNELACVVSDENKDLKIKGLIFGGKTPSTGLYRPVVVIKNFAELETYEVTGKIVLLNVPYNSRKEAEFYRLFGPLKAMAAKASGILIRSMTDEIYKSNRLYGGYTTFMNSIENIPAAVISPDSADYIARKVLENTGRAVKIWMKIDSHQNGHTYTRNIIVDLQKENMPDEFVVLTGHHDSSGLGEGVLSGGAAAFSQIMALACMKDSKDLQGRSVRLILFGAHELGSIGYKQYMKAHALEIPKWKAIIQAGRGAYTPIGWSFEGTDEENCYFKKVAAEFTGEDFNATTVIKVSGFNFGIPTMTPIFEPKDYDYDVLAHTEADVLDHVNEKTLKKNLLMYSIMSSILSRLYNTL